MMIFCALQRHTKGEELFNKVCEHLSIEEKEYFGLRYIDEKDGQVCSFALFHFIINFINFIIIQLLLT